MGQLGNEVDRLGLIVLERAAGVGGAELAAAGAATSSPEDGFAEHPANATVNATAVSRR